MTYILLVVTIIGNNYDWSETRIFIVAATQSKNDFIVFNLTHKLTNRVGLFFG